MTNNKKMNKIRQQAERLVTLCEMELYVRLKKVGLSDKEALKRAKKETFDLG